MNAETIKDFLVSLGFDVDEAGAQKFDSVLKGATVNAIKMGLAVEGAALSVVAFTAKIASGLDNLYWASQRTGATVEGIKSIGYAVSQVGGSADAARGSLESLSRFVRNNPGAEGFLNRLGVQTRDAKGNMRDMASVFTGVGQKLSSMPYYRANQYAQMLGIDENTLMAMRRGVGGFSGQYSAMAKAIGFNADEAAKSSNKFMTSLREFSAMAGMARDKIGSNLAGGLAGSLDTLRRHILDNFPRIEQTLTKAIKGILALGDIIGRFFFRLIEGASDLIDWWHSLDKSTKQLIAIFGALTLALKILNSTFWMSPVGLVTALAAAIALLWEDYKTWKEGGQSLIDWAKWEPAIKYVLDALKQISAAFGKLWGSIKGLGVSLGGLWDKLTPLVKEFGKLLGLDFSKFSAKSLFDSLTNSITDSIKVLSNLVDALKKVIDGDFSGAFDSLKLAGGIIVDEAKGSIAGGIYQKLNNKLNQYLPEWMGGAPSDPEQHAQSVKRPQATAQGKVLLDWMAPTFNKLESLYRLPEGLLKSVALTESGGNQFAMSGAGAKGLFQFMDGTAKDMGLRGNDVFDPAKSAQAAAKYLSQLLKQNGGDLNKTLASYNWGIGNVQKHGMALMPQETRNYIPKVMSNMPGSGGAQVQQQNTYHIYGGGDARAVGSEVERRQQSANAQVMRGNQTKVG